MFASYELFPPKLYLCEFSYYHFFIIFVFIVINIKFCKKLFLFTDIYRTLNLVITLSKGSFNFSLPNINISLQYFIFGFTYYHFFIIFLLIVTKENMIITYWLFTDIYNMLNLVMTLSKGSFNFSIGV